MVDRIKLNSCKTPRELVNHHLTCKIARLTMTESINHSDLVKHPPTEYGIYPSFK